jgi:hypothetical protein
MRTILVYPAAALLAVAAVVAHASQADLVRFTTTMELDQGRATALRLVAGDPTSADAVAAATWWLDHLSSLPEPGEILDVVAGPTDPEVRFILSRIASQLHDGPPADVLADLELAGPWGTFGLVELGRAQDTGDRPLPPPETPWRGPETPYRVPLRSLDGGVAVPSQLQFGGVVTVLGTFTLASAFDGYLAVEGRGSLRLAVNDQPVADLTYAGLQDPEITWYRTRLAAGHHRINVAMAPVDVASVRLSLIGADGSLPLLEPAAVESGWAQGSVTPGDPPARQALSAVASADREDLLRHVASAKLRGDPRRHEAAVRALLDADPDDAIHNLIAADYYLFAPTGAATEVDYRAAGDHLRAASGLPLQRLMAYHLALRQQRDEDADGLLDDLVTHHPDDPRVLRLRIAEAIRNGWGREAEEALARLVYSIGDRRETDRIRLDVLDAEHRWREYAALLQHLGRHDEPDLDLVADLAQNCRFELALEASERLLASVSDPDIEAEVIRLWLDHGQLDRARAATDDALTRWGPLERLVALWLETAPDEAARNERLLRVLDLRPGDVQLHSLAWDAGLVTPFWRDHTVDALALAAKQEEPAENLDSILILDQAVERVFPDGSSLYYYHGLSKALTPQGARRIGQLQQMPGLVRLRLRIVKPDGRIVVPSDVGPNTANLALRDIEPGDLVEEQYVAGVERVAPNRRGHLPPYTYRFADSDRAFGLSEYALILPADLEILVAGVFDGLEYEDVADGDLRTIRWRSRGVPPIPAEPFGPPSSELLPWVTYGFAVSWADVGNSLRERILPTLRTTPELERFAAQRLDGGDPEAGLARFVDDLLDRVEAGERLLDTGLSAGGSFSLERGNRLGITAGALAGAGWEVDLVMARPRMVAGTHLEVPSPDLFLAPVLRVTRNERTFWIDLRENRAGVGRINAILQGGDALVVPLTRPDVAPFILDELPTFPNPQLEERSALRAEVAEDGSAAVTFTMWLRDAQAEQLRQNLQSVPTDRLDMVYGRMASGLFPGATAVRGSTTDDEQMLELTLSLQLPNACDVSGTELRCRSLVVSRPLAPTLASLPERTFDLILDLPVIRSHQATIVPPDGWRVEAAPRRIQTRWGSVEESRSPADDGATISDLRLEVPAVTVSPDEYAEFARFCRAVDELMSRPPTLTRAANR